MSTALKMIIPVKHKRSCLTKAQPKHRPMPKAASAAKHALATNVLVVELILVIPASFDRRSSKIGNGIAVKAYS
jgi:hypothetical protein